MLQQPDRLIIIELRRVELPHSLQIPFPIGSFSFSMHFHGVYTVYKRARHMHRSNAIRQRGARGFVRK
jgi:hypothetical protein